MTTPFIVLVEGARDLLDRASDNINDTGKTAYKMEVQAALFSLNQIADKYWESVDRYSTEKIKATFTEVK